MHLQRFHVQFRRCKLDTIQYVFGFRVIEHRDTPLYISMFLCSTKGVYILKDE